MRRACCKICYQPSYIFIIRASFIGKLCFLHCLSDLRDLKLENFLFEDKGTNSPLKLIDFGLSKHFSPHEQMRQVVGSAYYTAPEVLRGNYDQRCDVWSIGVIGYMLLSGCPPFYGSNSDAIHDMILTEEADFTSKRFSHVSALALDFLQKVRFARILVTVCLAPCQRCESAINSRGGSCPPIHSTSNPAVSILCLTRLQVNNTGLTRQTADTSNEVVSHPSSFIPSHHISRRTPYNILWK